MRVWDICRVLSLYLRESFVDKIGRPSRSKWTIICRLNVGLYNWYQNMCPPDVVFHTALMRSWSCEVGLDCGCDVWPRGHQEFERVDCDTHPISDVSVVVKNCGSSQSLLETGA